MNRMAPLVRRRIRQPGNFAVAAPSLAPDLAQAVGWLNDAKLFAGGWVAGLVIFGTLFG
jgi:hypothetical protein